MTDSATLLAHVRAAEAAAAADAGATDGADVDAARAAYLEHEPTGVVAAEMHYRLGLSRLFRYADGDGAMEHFRLAAQEKGSPIAPEARVSLALCLHNKGKRPQAIFELRKLLPQGVPPSAHTAQALDFLALLLREGHAAATDIAAVDVQRTQHLQALAAAAQGVERAHFLLRLAAAHSDVGTSAALALARATYNDVVKLGVAAGDSALTAARTALKNLPR